MSDEIDGYLEMFEVWLTGKFGGRPPCVLCHSTDIGITYRPAFAIWMYTVCRTCGHIETFDAETIGILPPLPPETSGF